MDLTLFVTSLALSVVGPVLALLYLRPILRRVLERLCNGAEGAEFWMRSAILLAVSGTLLLTLTFGAWSHTDSIIDALRRTLWLVMAGIFASVGVVASQVWRQIRPLLVPSATPRPAPAPHA